LELIDHRFKHGGDVGNRHTFIALGDTHVGSAGCDMAKLKRDIAWLKEQNPETTHLILMGDLGDYVDQGDRRFDQEDIDHDVIDLYSGTPIHEQILDALMDDSLFGDVDDYLRCALRGNHGQQNKADATWQRYDRVLAQRLGWAPMVRGTDPDRPGWGLHGGYTAFVRFQFVHVGGGGKKRTALFHVHHGWQSGRTAGAKVNQLQREIGMFPTCDVLLRGHSHEHFAWKFTTLQTNQRFTDIRYRDVIVGHTGTYLSAYQKGGESYGERGLYPPTAPGFLKVWVDITGDGIDLWSGV